MKMSGDQRLPRGWRKSSYSWGCGECVEVAQSDSLVLVRDSMNPSGSALRLTRGGWDGFTRRVKDEESVRTDIRRIDRLGASPAVSSVPLSRGAASCRVRRRGGPGRVQRLATPGGCGQGERRPPRHSRLLTPNRHRLIIGPMTGIRLADRMARLGTESAFEVLARARAIEDAGGKVIHLEIGEPDFPTAPHIVEAAIEALHAGATHYVPAPGIPPLRQAVAAFLERTGRMRVTPDRVIITPGAKPIMFFTILALAAEGDEVLYPDPGFPMYESITSFAGAVPVPGPAARAQRLPHRHGRTRAADHEPDQAADHQLAAQPVRQRAHPRGLRGDRRHRHAARPRRADRRGVLGHQVRRSSTPACSTSTGWPTGRSCSTGGRRPSR